MTEQAEVKQQTKKNESGIHGKEYERNILALIGLKCLLDVSIKDFWLMSNPKGIEKFDDIVLFIEFNNGSQELFFTQLKHAKNKDAGLLTAQMFEINAHKYKDWYLGAYQDAFISIKKTDNLFFQENGINDNISKQFLIYTNRRVRDSGTNPENEKPTLKIEKMSSTEVKHFINSSINKQVIYKFSQNNSTNQTFDKDFLDSLTLYSDQICLPDTVTTIEAMLNLKPDLSENIIQTFHNFANPKCDITKLTKTDIKQKVLRTIFGEYNPPISLDDNFVENNMVNLLKSYDVTIITNEISKDIMWKCLSAEIRVLNSYSENLTVEEIRNLYLPMVARSEIPFFIRRDNSSFNNFVNYLLPKLKTSTIVYDNKGSQIEFADELKILRNMNDFSQESLNMFKDRIKLSLQGKDAIALHDIIKDAIPVKKNISFDLFLKLIGKPLKIGKQLDIPQYYTKRKIKIPLLNKQILNDDRWLFVICSSSDNFTAFDNLNTVSLESYLSDDDENYIVTTAEPFTLHLIKTIEKKAKKPLFIFGYTHLDDDVWLSLMYTNGRIEFLKQYQTYKYNIVQDVNLLETCGKIPVNIICDNPGTGKSMLLKFISSRFSLDTWVVYVDLWKHTNKIKAIRDKKGLIEFFYSLIQTNQPYEFRKFYLQLCNHCLDTEKLVCLIDDYEEINNPKFLELLKQVSYEGLKIWIVGRPTCKSDFENIFGTYVMEINEFDKEDQSSFFRKFLENRNHKNVVQAVENLENISKKFDESFIGKCQQITMLAEVFNSDVSNISETQPFDVSIEKLYEKFTKLEIRNSLNKSKSLVSNEMFEENDLRIVSKMALYHFFNKNTLSKIFDWEEFLCELNVFKQNYQKHNLIMGYKDQNVPIFTHLTYAEFLVGNWLSKTVKKQIQNETPFDVKKLVKMLYSFPKLTTIRMFFDRILIQDNPVFNTIINRDYTELPTQLKDSYFLTERDILGRSAIHILMSYGCTRYDVGTDIQEEDALQSIYENRHYATLTEQRKSVFVDISQSTSFIVKGQENLNKLLNSVSKMSLMKKAEYLDLNALDIALITGSLKELNQVIKKAELDPHELEKEKIYFLAYHCVRHNFNNILDCLNLTKLQCSKMRVASNRMSLLHLAVVYKNVEATRKLLKIKPLENWGIDFEGNTPLHLACECKRKDKEDILKRRKKILDIFCRWKKISVDFLMQKNNKGRIHLHSLAYFGHVKWVHKISNMGINVDVECNSGNTPFMLSVINNKLKIAKILKLRKADVNHRNDKQMTALHYAAMKNLPECCQQLIEWEADVNVKDRYGTTPLMKASGWGCEKVVHILLKNDARINVTDSRKQTALHYVIKHRRKKMIKILFDAGADIQIKDQNGNSALDIARRNFNDGYKILKRLQQAH